MLRLPPMTDCVWFHVVTSGRLLLLDSSGARRPVGPGDLIVLPRGVSRSGFSARFRELVGEGPMHDVARWRMLIATDLLQTDRLTVAAVGERLGYASEAAFSRAFKRATGLAPGAVRRRTPLDLVAG